MFTNLRNQPQADLLKIALTALACYVVRSAMAPPKPAFHFNDNIRFSDATKNSLFNHVLGFMRNMTILSTRNW